MNFFGEQRIRTRRSLLLYGLFFLIVLIHMVVALAIMGLLLTVFTDGVYHWVLVLVLILILGSFAGGSFLEYRRLRAGGRAQNTLILQKKKKLAEQLLAYERLPWHQKVLLRMRGNDAVTQ